MIYSPERKNNNQNKKTYWPCSQNLSWSKDCSLCLLWSSFITSDLIGPSCPSPCCPCLCWALTTYLSPFWRTGPAPTALPRAEPIPLRPQATPFLHRAQLHISRVLQSLTAADEIPIKWSSNITILTFGLLKSHFVCLSLQIVLFRVNFIFITSLQQYTYILFCIKVKSHNFKKCFQVGAKIIVQVAL